MSEEKAARVFKALGNPTRLKMVRDLRKCRNTAEKCGELSAKSRLSQPTMSHHFSRLIEAGVIYESKLGTEKLYSLNLQLLDDLGLDYRRL